MTKSTQRKWKRANRFMRLWFGRPVETAGRWPDSLDWATKYEFTRRSISCASLALDGLSIKDLH